MFISFKKIFVPRFAESGFVVREKNIFKCNQSPCLIVWGLLSHSRIFHSYGDVTITGANGFNVLPLLGTYGQ